MSNLRNLSVRKLDPQIYENLRMRAVKHGVSMEEEVRQIIYNAVEAPEKISDVFLHFFGSENGIDLELQSQRKPHNPMDFSE